MFGDDNVDDDEKAQRITSSGPVSGKPSGSFTCNFTPVAANTRLFRTCALYLKAHSFHPGVEGCILMPCWRARGIKQAWQWFSLHAVSCSLRKKEQEAVLEHLPPQPVHRCLIIGYLYWRSHTFAAALKIWSFQWHLRSHNRCRKGFYEALPSYGRQFTLWCVVI